MPNLSSADLASFTRLGISLELLQQAGIERVTDDEARQKFGINGPGDRAGIIFPYRDPLNGVRYTARLRRDRPDIENGKEVKKYLAPYGDPRHFYFVPGCGAVVHDAVVPIVLVEAEKSALALTAWRIRTGLRILPVALGGCWGWRGRIGKRENSKGERVDEVGPLPELRICSDGRNVYILLDSNAATNSKVQQARSALAQQLRKQRADVYILELPASDGVNGPDDFIGICGDEAMANLFAAAEGGPAVLAEVEAFIRRYVVASDAEITLMSAWVLHTYAVSGQTYTPYLAINSAEKRCGKSRTLEVLGFLVHRPWKCDSASVAALFRKIEKCRPTLLFDEADANFKGDPELAQALRGLFNSGNHHKGSIARCVGEGSKQQVVDFSTFCAKAIAGIGVLPDTVADRSIPIRLKRKMPGESIERLRERRVEPEAVAIRKQITAWADKHGKVLLTSEPEPLDGLSDRQMDAIEPLLAIADEVGAGWPDRIRKAALDVFSGKASEDQSIGVQLLADIKSVFEDKGVDRIPSEDLVAALVEMEDRPWPEFGKSGKAITKATLGKLLSKKYDISPRNVRIGEVQLKGYDLTWFKDAFSRYLPPLPTSEVSQPSQANVYAGPEHFCEVSQESSGTDAKSGDSSMFMRSGTDGTDEKPEKGGPEANEGSGPEDGYVSF